MARLTPVDAGTGAVPPVGSLEINTPELLKFSVPDATVVAAPAGAGDRSADGMVTA
jgi:hypothetical protein